MHGIAGAGAFTDPENRGDDIALPGEPARDIPRRLGGRDDDFGLDLREGGLAQLAGVQGEILAAFIDARIRDGGLGVARAREDDDSEKRG